MSVVLAKGQTISLAEADATPLVRVRMGLGWQAVPRKGFLEKLIGPKKIDFYASALLYSGREVVEAVSFNYLVSIFGAVRHSGGSCPWDDEAITVDFTRVRPEVDQVVITVNSFAGVTFDKVGHAYCRVVDDTTGGELARYTVCGGGHHTTQIMAKLVRLRGGWQLTAIGEPAAGETR